MKTYVVATGLLFGLLALVHVWRMVEERPLMTDPWYLLVTLAAGAMSVWAWRVVRVGRS
jgi:hypothetical protein